MGKTNYNSCMRCVCVGGGDFASQKFQTRQDDLVIGVDKGYEYIRDQRVDMVVGDFDSLGYAPAHPNIIKLDVRKDFTDMWVACESGREKGCSEFVLYGGLGGRLDHTLANLQLAYHLAEEGCKVTFVDVAQTILVTNSDLELVGKAGKTISIFAKDQATITLTGFDYPAQNFTLKDNFPMGVSNVATAEIAKIQVHSGTIVVVVNDFVD